MNPRKGPLNDIRVLDMTQALAGPFCTMLLADMGADVIKVEPPHGDMSRSLGPAPPDPQGCDYGGLFASVNRNKRSVVLDVKTEAGRAAILKLAEHVDAFVENSKAGVMDRAGVGYEKLRAINPKIVYAAVRGFGDPRTGKSPYVDWPAFDVVAQSMGGLVAMTGPANSLGYRAGPGIGDTYPGTLAALGVVSAIHAARNSGRGQFLDVSMYDAVLSLCDAAVYTYSRTGVSKGPPGNASTILCPFDIFPTNDGAIAIAAPNENQWVLLCEAMGRADLIHDDRCRDNLQRVANDDFVRGIVSSWTLSRTKQDILEAIGGKVPVGPVNDAKDIFADPHPRARAMIVEVEQPGRNPPLALVASPIKFTQTPAGIYSRAPKLGEHTIEVLTEAGISLPSK
jgi:crotonobetainyl-CoA:carnitine CoA-transferase CaiB-like acyl-CoA transferase